MNNTIDLAVELEKLFAGKKQYDFKPFDLSKELVNKMDNDSTEIMKESLNNNDNAEEKEESEDDDLN